MKKKQRFDIHDMYGRRIYIGMRRMSFGFDWAKGNGFITDEQVERYGWEIRPATCLPGDWDR